MLKKYNIKEKIYNIKTKQHYHVEDSEIGRILVSKDEQSLFMIDALKINPTDWVIY